MNDAQYQRDRRIFFEGEHPHTTSIITGKIAPQPSLPQIPIKLLYDWAQMPKKGNVDDIGWDLYAAEDAIIRPNETVTVGVGFSVQLPPNWEMQIRPRSGVSYKTRLRIANSPGTIDPRYTDEVGVIFDNIYVGAGNVNRRYYYGIDGKAHDLDSFADPVDEGTYIIRKGDRIAQAVFMPVPPVELTTVTSIEETDRGNGFGSSGTR